MISKNLLSFYIFLDYKAESTQTSSEHVADTLMRQPKSAWATFIKVLVEDGQKNLAEKLDKGIADMVKAPEKEGDVICQTKRIEILKEWQEEDRKERRLALEEEGKAVNSNRFDY